MNCKDLIGVLAVAGFLGVPLLMYTMYQHSKQQGTACHSTGTTNGQAGASDTVK